MAFVTALIGTLAMWWISFNIGAERASARITASTDPGRLARLAYTYVHIVLVGGIIVSAVADELILSHPWDETETSARAVLIGGPALYLIGNILFKRATASRMVLSHFVGLGLLGCLSLATLPPLPLGAAASLVMVLVATWETLSLKGEGGSAAGTATRPS